MAAQVDLVERYIAETGRLAGHYRDLAGRSQGSFVDALHALHDLGTDAQSMPLERSTTATSVRKLVRFPAPAEVQLASTALLNMADDRPAERTPEVPPWLPLFPERHTYISTDVLPKSLAPAELQALRQERKVAVEGYLDRLHQSAVAAAPARQSTLAPVAIDQEYADEHAAKRARVVLVEEGQQQEEEVQAKAERILSNKGQ